MIIPEVHEKNRKLMVSQRQVASLDGDPISRIASHFEGVAIFFPPLKMLPKKKKASQPS